jgi:ligand-binding sensor domain-containing protein
MRTLGFLIATLAIAGAHAASPLPSQFVLNTWDTTTGLPEETIHSISRTPDGYLWLANANGLVRYGGNAFQTYHPRKDLGGWVKQEITRLGPGPDGSIWVYSTSFGLARFAGGVFRRAPPYPAPCGVMQILSDGEGTLVVCAERVLRMVGERVEQLTAASGGGIQSAARGVDGQLWIGLNRGGVARLDAGGQLTTVYGPREGMPDAPVTYLVSGGENRLWVGTERGLARVEDGRVKVFTTRDGLPSDNVRRLMPGAARSLWVGTTRGVSLCREGRFDSFPAIPAASVESILEDREENVWVSSSILSLYRLTRPKFLPWGRPEGLAYEHPRAVVQVGRETWVAQDSGISRVVDGEVKRLSLGRGGLRFLEVDAAGRVWALTTIAPTWYTRRPARSRRSRSRVRRAGCSRSAAIAPGECGCSRAPASS